MLATFYICTTFHGVICQVTMLLFEIIKNYYKCYFSQQNLHCNTEKTFLFVQTKRLSYRKRQIKAIPERSVVCRFKRDCIQHIYVYICDNNISKTNSRAITIRRAANPMLKLPVK